MTLHCLICDQELLPGEEHVDLIQCVRALVQYIKGSEHTFDRQLDELQGRINGVETTADEALQTAKSADSRVSELE